jgi:hypothetical protein
MLLLPAGIVTDKGTWATDVLLLVSDTTAPAGGAAPFSVNVPVEDDPPVTVFGFKESAVRDATLTVRVVVRVFPYTAEIVTEVDDATPLVVIVKVVLVDPAAISTLAGTCAADVLLLCNVTSAPPAGARPLKVTVPVELFPPTTEVGVLVSEDRVGALTVRVVVLVTTKVPEIATDVLADTGVVVMVKVALMDPAAISTLAGTCAADVLLLCSVTTAPPVGAARVRVAVPVELAPPIKEGGFSVSDDRDGGAVTVRVAVRLTPRVPVITDEVSAVTALVVTTKVADVLPAKTVTEIGT